MTTQFILSDYVNQAMRHSMYDKLEDNSFAGRISICQGVVAFGTTLRECENESRSAFEDWILLGLKLRHPMPVIEGIDLNEEPRYESVGAM